MDYYEYNIVKKNIKVYIHIYMISVNQNLIKNLGLIPLCEWIKWICRPESTGSIFNWVNSIESIETDEYSYYDSLFLRSIVI